MVIYMKKMFLMILFLLLINILVGCNELQSFNAKVLEVNNSLLVQPLSGTNEEKIADKITINLNNCTIINSEKKELSIDDIEIGGIVEIYYDGVVLTSYPAQIKNCRLIIIT